MNYPHPAMQQDISEEDRAMIAEMEARNKEMHAYRASRGDLSNYRWQAINLPDSDKHQADRSELIFTPDGVVVATLLRYSDQSNYYLEVDLYGTQEGMRNFEVVTKPQAVSLVERIIQRGY